MQRFAPAWFSLLPPTLPFFRSGLHLRSCSALNQAGSAASRPPPSPPPPPPRLSSPPFFPLPSPPVSGPRESAVVPREEEEEETRRSKFSVENSYQPGNVVRRSPMPAAVSPRDPRTTPAALRPPQQFASPARPRLRSIRVIVASLDTAEACPCRRVWRTGGHRVFVSWCSSAPPLPAHLGVSLFGVGDSACLCSGRARRVLPPQSTTEEARPGMAHYPDQEHHKQPAV